MSLYAKVVEPFEFVDRLVAEPGLQGVDVIVPLLHATPFWTQNLHSYFREIPIRRLLVGDAGAIDGSPQVAAGFPRTVIFDHSELKTLGRSIAELMSAVESEHFVYLQSDTFLPPGWFDKMWMNRERFDWFGCPERALYVLSAPQNDYTGIRPLPGTQFGKSSVFKGVSDFVQDDYGYRQEDFIFEEYALRSGGRVGSVSETFHIHQITERVTKGKQMEVLSVRLKLKPEVDDGRALDTQLLGFVKYCNPRRKTVQGAAYDAILGAFSAGRFSIWRELTLATSIKSSWTSALIGLYIKACIYFLPGFLLRKGANRIMASMKAFRG